VAYPDIDIFNKFKKSLCKASEEVIEEELRSMSEHLKTSFDIIVDKEKSGIDISKYIASEPFIDKDIDKLLKTEHSRFSSMLGSSYTARGALTSEDIYTAGYPKILEKSVPKFRRKIFKIQLMDLTSIMSIGTTLPNFMCTRGVPRDAKIIHAIIEVKPKGRDSWVIKILYEHPSFDEILGNETYPEIDVEYGTLMEMNEIIVADQIKLNKVLDAFDPAYIMDVPDDCKGVSKKYKLSFDVADVKWGSISEGADIECGTTSEGLRLALVGEP